MLQLPRDQTYLTHDEDLRTTGGLEAEGGAVGLHAREDATTDAIFIVRQVMEKYREKRNPCYLAFLDLEKAYDRLPRAVLCKALRGKGVPECLITVIKNMYGHLKAAIRTPHGVTRKVDITVEVHQGSALSPFLFLMTLDSIVNHLEEGPFRTTLYADDIALVTENQEEL
ncbi:unnamed protein product [Heligmosomoides polygyrus]|uniref:Reverse transcriptase domain-containing protein n=1 Tax=Heligmosomoides polygyrus TaxID=6339 RepID=A0A183FJA4_HELPZ|nr:unnamed protein product [Heligmosomoides polygyrus]